MFEVVLRRRWFGEEMEQKLAEYDHAPSEAELLELARRHGLGGGATLYVQLKGKGPGQEYRVRDLSASPSPSPRPSPIKGEGIRSPPARRAPTPPR